MLNLNYFTKYEGNVKTLTFKKEDSPLKYGLGHYIDVNNIKWDVNCIIGNKIYARTVNNTDPYYLTQSDTNISGSRTWLPYNVKLI
ncbi:MAG: hypothetical protein ACOCVF_02740 [bacterium]